MTRSKIPFLICLLISLAKSFNRHGNTIGIFDGQSADKILSVLSIPQVALICAYLLFLLYAYLVFRIVRAMKRPATFKEIARQLVVPCLWVGLPCHVTFFVLGLFLPVALMHSLFWGAVSGRDRTDNIFADDYAATVSPGGGLGEYRWSSAGSVPWWDAVGGSLFSVCCGVAGE